MQYKINNFYQRYKRSCYYRIKRCKCGKIIVCKNLVNRCKCGNLFDFYGGNTADYTFNDPMDEADGAVVYYGEGIIEY